MQQLGQEERVALRTPEQRVAGNTVQIGATEIRTEKALARGLIQRRDR